MTRKKSKMLLFLLKIYRKLEKILETNSQAIFDLIWIPKLLSNKLCFLVALAEPKIELYHYQDGNSKIQHF